jgi:hypothetical protein
VRTKINKREDEKKTDWLLQPDSAIIFGVAQTGPDLMAIDIEMWFRFTLIYPVMSSEFHPCEWLSFVLYNFCSL